MKTSLLALTFVVLAPVGVLAAPARKTAPKVEWQPSYAAALKAARHSGKPLFIDFYTDWCGPCKYMEQTTYKDPKFVAHSRGWIMVKVNPEKSAAGRKLFNKYHLDGYPSMVLTDASGQKHGLVVGSSPTNALINEMRRAARKAGGISV